MEDPASRLLSVPSVHIETNDISGHSSGVCQQSAGLGVTKNHKTRLETLKTDSESQKLLVPKANPQRSHFARPRPASNMSDLRDDWPAHLANSRHVDRMAFYGTFHQQETVCSLEQKSLKLLQGEGQALKVFDLL